MPRPKHSMEIIEVDIDLLIPAARNARTHDDQQVAEIAALITELGFTNPCLISPKYALAAGGIVPLTPGQGFGMVAGHGRVLAAKLLGDKTVECRKLSPDLTEVQIRAMIIADNQAALNAGWDAKLLHEEVVFLQDNAFDVGLLAFRDELTDIMAWEPQGEGARDPDAAPNPPAQAVSKLGDIWKLGAHQVMCGDSTSTNDWARLMGTALADVCWTDPPYNVDYDGSDTNGGPKGGNANRAQSKIKNDSMTDTQFRTFLLAVFRQLHKVIKPGGSIYVAHAETERANFTEQFRFAQFKMSGTIIWRKHALVLGRSPYQWQHEPILFGWKPGRAHRWFGGRKQTTIAEWGDQQLVQPRDDGRFQISVGDAVLIVDGTATIEQVEPSVLTHQRPSSSDMHPTMKPVGLVARMLRNSARRGDLVVDAFGGSGSTLIAADTLGMEARLMELDPPFVDVIVQRWQDWTGRRALHAETGKEFPHAPERPAAA